MTVEIPRVTYSNINVDFTPVHDLLDREVPAFDRRLGSRWPNVVGGESAEGGSPYIIKSPIDSEIAVAESVESSPEIVDLAVGAARAAFPAWSATPWRDRIAILKRWAAELECQKYALAIASIVEIGKSRLEAVGEAEEAVDLVTYYCSEMERNGGYERSLQQAFDAETTRSVMRPLGAFAVIAPFNFPVALAVNMVAGGLVTGNTVVFKPSPGCSLTGGLIVKAALDAGLPPGVVNLVNGSDAVGQRLVANPDIAGVAFTGSHAAGMSIFRSLAAAGNARPVIAEMGGKNPAYVTKNADIFAAAEGVARSAFGLQGQKCSACSVAYVDADVHGAFLEALAAFAGKLALGDPRRRDVFMGPAYGAAAAERHAGAVREAARTGRVVAGGGRRTGDGYDRGYYLEPTIVDLPEPQRITREELFVPFVAVRKVGSLGEGLREGNAVQYGLSAGVYTRDESELRHFLREVEAGVVYANRRSGATTGAWPGMQSFCGWKGSGVTNKGGLGPHYLPQFLREQSQTIIF